jgi:hypothetical protein
MDSNHDRSVGSIIDEDEVESDGLLLIRSSRRRRRAHPPQIQLSKSQVQEQHQQDDSSPAEDPQYNTSSSIFNVTSSSADTIISKSAATASSVSDLPSMLQFLFGLNGLTLSLLTLPLMYIVNTRVEVPLPYLPAYGAIAFLPYSLKPIYAYLCNKFTCRSTSMTIIQSRQQGRQQQQHQLYYNNNIINNRYLQLFSVLLTCNSIFTVLFACIPKGGVIWIFVISFIRGVTDSWAEFCLGLTLIDHARTMENCVIDDIIDSNIDYNDVNNSDSRNRLENQTTQQQQQQQSNSNSQQSYDAIVSKLQAQAATARNIGAFLASFVTCMLFLERYLMNNNKQQQLSGGVANALIIVTAIIQLLGAIMVYLYYHNKNGINNNNSNYEEIPTSSTGIILQVQQNSSTIIPATELNALHDEENSSHPSYSSLEDLAATADETDSLSTTDSSGNGSNNSIAVSISRNNRSGSSSRNNNTTSTTTAGVISNWIMVILLQLILVTIAVKGPIIEWTSHFIWNVLVTTLIFAIMTTAVALYCNNSWQMSHRVGLFLILRNAIPSDSMIVSSFFYSLFQSQPLLLQLLSFLGAGVISLSSWSYTKLWSRYSGGRPLLFLMGGTVVLASIASLLNIAVFRQYQHNDNDDSKSSNSSVNTNVIIIAIISKFVTTFFSEWAFLPEVILATTSVKHAATATTTTSSHNDDDDIIENNEDIGSSSHQTSNPATIIPVFGFSTITQDNEPDAIINNSSNNGHTIVDYDKTIAMEYGTLISCIDFGDQLGSLTAAPLVAFLNISRENGFLHLDHLILICALTNMVVSLGLLPLLVERRK